MITSEVSIAIFGGYIEKSCLGAANPVRSSMAHEFVLKYSVLIVLEAATNGKQVGENPLFTTPLPFLCETDITAEIKNTSQAKQIPEVVWRENDAHAQTRLFWDLPESDHTGPVGRNCCHAHVS